MKKKEGKVVPISTVQAQKNDAVAEMESNVIGLKIREARKKKSLSIAGFCERLKDFGVETSVGATGKWELGYSVPNAYQLIALCLALDIEDQIPFFMKNYTPALNSEVERKVQEYRDALTAAGLVISGLSPDGRLVETVELRDHPFFVGVQFHPEFKSRPKRPHPLFLGFLEAALAGRKD